MALDLYRKKRSFKTTPEPKGRVIKRKHGDLTYVIQKHAASRLHYDFRLELNGVLLSWAVPKGPSLDPNDKRLAMHVEDHPIEYGEFEGVIPPKQYGAGTVLLWDQGIWKPKEDPQTAYQKGKLKFELIGEKLRGGWTLVRSRSSKYGDKGWLLIKEDDAFAMPAHQGSVVDEKPESVASGRTLEAIAADPDRVWHSNKSVAENVKSGAVKKRKPPIVWSKQQGAREAAIPARFEPELATLVKTVPSGEEWLHEIKYDGYRMLCRIHTGEAELYSRNRKRWTAELTPIAHAAARLRVESAWIDGEVVALERDGRTNFQALQNALASSTERLFYYVFDLLYLDGHDLTQMPLVQRKRLLQSLIAPGGMLRYSEHVQGSGQAFFDEVCKLRLEGIVCKRADSHYQSGRSTAWLKVKCARRQEVVIGGFSDPEGSRSGFGALLVGVYEAPGKLRYSGKVGTGFDETSLASLRRTLDKLTQDASPFYNPPGGTVGRRAHWVKPELVAEVAFGEWTAEGTLRHPSFLGLRADKPASEVRREEPVATEAVSSREQPSAPRSPRSKSPASPAVPDKDTIAGIKLTNPDKLLYPEAKLTKRDLAQFYADIGEWIVPHLEGRPLTLVRCPNGWEKGCFYYKHADKSVAEVIERVTVKESGGTGVYMMANSVSAVVALLQMGVLEIHPWGSRYNKLGFPDRIVFDFDPDEDLPWDRITEAVGLLKTLLETIGLKGFLKATGGKGLHVVIPVEPMLAWDELKGFSKAIADVLVRAFPDRFTAKLSKATRRDKIFVDYLRNAEGATAIAPFSIRAKANAPVATPIDWSELRKDIRFDHFNVRNVARRLAKLKTDPWAGFFETRQSISKAMMKKVGYNAG